MFKEKIKNIFKTDKELERLFFERYLQPRSNILLDYNAKVHIEEEGNALIYNTLLKEEPVMLTRFGNVELHAVLNYLLLLKNKKANWHPVVKNSLYRLNTLFPAKEKSLEKFAILYLDEMKKIDVLGIWHNKGEEELFQTYFPTAKLIDLVSYESFFYDKPWTRVLEHKKVLVIHPYSDSIEKQYQQRTRLFDNADVLPEFDLKTFKPFNTMIDTITKNRTWFDEFESMKEKISKLDFDIALIAAGPFGLPLAGFIKTMGKQAVHIGGALQLLFGIKGQRWEKREQHKFFNDHWVRPQPQEMPAENIRLEVDNNSYW